MKRFLIVFVICSVTVASFAQDVIITYDTQRIDAIIQEVSETQVKYKKVDNLNGPIFVLGTDKIATIIYKNGEVQTFQKSNTEQNTTPSLRDIARLQDEQENPVHISTPAEGPWLVYGLLIKEGWNMYFASGYNDYSTNTHFQTIFGMRFLPCFEGYVEYAPKQEDMADKRRAVYFGLQYAFRGGNLWEGANGSPMFDLQYLCFRPAYSIERKIFYSHTGIELGVLTKAQTRYSDGYKSNVYAYCNKATFGIWEEFGWMIKDHFNIGLSFNYIISNSSKDVWGHEDYYGNWVSRKRYSPQLQFQIILGWRFNPYKFDKKKIEKMRE